MTWALVDSGGDEQMNDTDPALYMPQQLVFVFAAVQRAQLIGVPVHSKSDKLQCIGNNDVVHYSSPSGASRILLGGKDFVHFATGAEDVVRQYLHPLSI